jgi:hypothetical protein
MPYAVEHSCRLKDPDSIKNADRVARITKEDGRVFITGFWGSKDKPDKIVTQAVRYPKEKFSADKAREDCKRLSGSFEEAKKDSMTEDEKYVESIILKHSEKLKTKSISKQPIMKIGNWKGYYFSQDSLNDMVNAFEELTKTGKRDIPFRVKFTHDDDQEILKDSGEEFRHEKDGIFSLGWVNNLFVEGDTLFADLVEIPEKTYDLAFKAKKIKGLSPEVKINYEDKSTGKIYPHVLSDVAMLSSEHKAIRTLDDLWNLHFGDANGVISAEVEEGEKLFVNFSEDIVISYEEKDPKDQNGGDDMDQVKELTEKNQKLSEENEKLRKNSEATNTEKEKLLHENEELKTKNEASEKEKVEMAKKETEREADSFIEKNSEKITPAQKAIAKTLLMQEEKEILFSDGEKESNKSVSELFKDYIDKQPKVISFDEKTSHLEPLAEEKKVDQYGNVKTNTRTAQIVQKYSEENKVSYDEATRICREKGLIE